VRKGTPAVEHHNSDPQIMIRGCGRECAALELQLVNAHAGAANAGAANASGKRECRKTPRHSASAAAARRQASLTGRYAST
jgi:ribosomal protein L37E